MSANRGVIIKKIDKLHSYINSIAVSNNGENMVTSGEDGDLVLFKDFKVLKRFVKIGDNPINQVIISEDNRYVFTGDYEGWLRQYRIVDGNDLKYMFSKKLGFRICKMIT